MEYTFAYENESQRTLQEKSGSSEMKEKFVSPEWLLKSRAFERP